MDMKVQAEDVRKKAVKISQQTCSYGLSTNISRLAYFSVYLSEVSLTLTLSYISKEVLDIAQPKATRRFLRCLGFNPNMPRIVAYAPKLLRAQGVRTTMQMLRHLRAGTTAGKLFKIGISWLHRWAWIGQYVMSQPDRELPQTT